ncbi:murein biosynthesis integral membrane protein MurJ [Erysipelothrix rhusiopathiae]|uniref:murein biosynthesis integral membrane protein MurJ n=1 Tax=Erysipelothrix rhusiopathiae TaxID=1648 RepID=UPI00247FC0B1|nr:murein biosynthesis integral membrane protein MurJ [Erysipelothrix rhusiopathiae]
MKKNAIVLILLMVFNKFFGIFRELLLAKYFGATAITDAYIIASSIPNSLFSFIATGITTSFIPIFSKIHKREGSDKAEAFTSNIINILLVVFIGVIILAEIFTEPLVRVFASGFNAETMALAVSFTRITLLAVFFQTILAVLQGYLQLKERFAAHGISYVIMNIVIVISIILSKGNSVYLLAYGITLAIASQSFFIYLIAKRSGYKHQFKLKIRDEHIKIMLVMAVPVIIGSSIDQVNAIFDKTIASGVIEGGISIVNYSNKISDSIIGLFVSSIITVLFPAMAKFAANGDDEGLKNSISNTLIAVNMIVVPATLGMMVLSQPLVQLFFGRGAFTPEAVVLTSNVLIASCLGLIVNANAMILLRVFYSLGDTRRPVVYGAISVASNIVASLFFVQFMGLPGLTLGTSISKLVYFILIYYFLYKMVGDFNNKYIFKTVLKLIVSGSIMAAVVFFAYPFISPNFSLVTGLVLVVLIGILVYFVSVKLMKIEEFDQAIDSVKGKFISKVKH